MGLQYTNLWNLLYHIKKSGCKFYVVCPGSRNAPIIEQLINSDGATCFNHIDERSAGYLALGMAKQKNQPVAIVCTSGTAALNLAPAMAEAYYQNVCLIAMTADRPTGAEHSFEAQSINQTQIFNNFVAAQLDIDVSQKWSPQLIDEMSEKTAIAFIKNLPIHLNLRLSEPLYDFEFNSEHIGTRLYNSEKRLEQFINIQNTVPNEIIEKLKLAQNPLLFLGFDIHNHSLKDSNYNFPVLADACSPNYADGNIFCYDYFLKSLNNAENTALKPDVLITTGSYMLSKNLRNWLKANPPIYHLHLGPQHNYRSPFTANFDVINCPWDDVFNLINQNVKENYMLSWQSAEHSNKNQLNAQIDSQSSLFYKTLTALLLKSKTNVLHCGNSMSVRYGALFQSLNKKFDYLIANRGTSGIDGCLSTFLGYALLSEQQEWLVIGDISFFYDCNAFWVNRLPQDFVIIVINNYKGQIFDVISGPEKMRNGKSFVTTPHKKSVKHIAALHQIKYHAIHTIEDAEALNFNKKQWEIIEIFDDNPQTVTDYQQLYS